MAYFATIAIVLVGFAFVYYAPLQRLSIPRPLVALLGALVLTIITARSMAYQVPAGHVGLVYAFGGIVGQRPDGLQWVAPWQELRFASVQVQGHSFPKLESFSRQSQDVYVAATINVQVSPQHIQDLYREVGQDYFNVLA